VSITKGTGSVDKDFCKEQSGLIRRHMAMLRVEVIRLINTIKSAKSVASSLQVSYKRLLIYLSITAYISSSCKIILGMPLRIGNFLPVPGHIK
jgi:hypothetical protein